MTNFNTNWFEEIFSKHQKIAIVGNGTSVFNEKMEIK